MTKTQMPEPVTYAIFAEKGNIRIGSRAPGCLPDADSRGPMCHLITTTLAEAYAEARVREALEDLIDTLETRQFGGQDQIIRAARALIPKE